jgi:hypothetical protein
MPEIFVIHHSTDDAVATRLADEIAKAGVTVAKMAPDLHPATATTSFRTQIDEARAVVVVWSPRSVISQIVQALADLALREGKLLPLRTHDLNPPDIPPPFAQLRTPLINDWDAIGDAISAKFEAPAAGGSAAPAAPDDALPEVSAPVASPVTPAPPPPVVAPAPVIARESESVAVAAPAPPPAPAPVPPRRTEGIGAAAPMPRVEGIGSAPDGPSIYDKAWRLERDLGHEKSGNSIRFGVPAPKAIVPKPASLTVDTMQQQRDTAKTQTAPRTPTREIADSQPETAFITDDVDCSVFAPPSARRGSTIMVQVFLHLLEQAERAQFLAETMDGTATLRGIATLQTPIPRRTHVTIELDGRGLAVVERWRGIYWNGQPSVASFEVEVPAGLIGDTCHPVVRILIDGEPVGRILFQIRIEPATRDTSPLPAAELSGTSAKHYQHAFLSYASQDRAEVLKRAQAFQAAKLAFFQDVLSLEPGQRYSEEILHRVDGSDLFVLFWSRHAMRSKWVQQEIDRALARQKKDPAGLPDIVPIMLEPVAVAPPPPALAHLHMNAPINSLIAASQSSLMQRIKSWLGR